MNHASWLCLPLALAGALLLLGPTSPARGDRSERRDVVIADPVAPGRWATKRDQRTTTIYSGSRPRLYRIYFVANAYSPVTVKADDQELTLVDGASVDVEGKTITITGRDATSGGYQVLTPY